MSDLHRIADDLEDGALERYAEDGTRELGSMLELHARFDQWLEDSGDQA